MQKKKTHEKPFIKKRFEYFNNRPNDKRKINSRNLYENVRYEDKGKTVDDCWQVLEEALVGVTNVLIPKEIYLSKMSE